MKEIKYRLDENTKIKENGTDMIGKWDERNPLEIYY